MSIVVENVIKEYSRRGTKFKAVDNVSLVIPKGKVVAVMGRSGSGKSTLLNIIAGMIKPEEGSVHIDDVNIFDVKAKKRDELRAGKVSIIPQTQSLISGLNIYYNIRLQASFRTKASDTAKKIIPEVVDALGLSNLLNIYPSNLSGGEMKRVAIARALVGDSEYIFADEPTGELDKQNSENVMALFRKEASSGKGVLIITHDDVVSQNADIVYTMENGILN